MFRLLEEIVSRERNNFVRGFERFDDIGNWLRDQWAGLFADFISRRSSETNLKDLAQRVAELGQITSALKEYSESLLRKIQPEHSEEIMAARNGTSSRRVRRFAREPMIDYLMGPDRTAFKSYARAIVSGFRSAADLESFLKAQAFEQILRRNLSAVVAACGGTLDDVVKITIFVTDPSYRPAVTAARLKWFKEGQYPASTYLVVSALAVPELLVEVEAVAMI